MKTPSRTVVVIEDDADIRERVVKGLTLSGYQVFAAENGAVGVGLARAKTADVIICDMLMPELNGFGTLAVLHDHPDTTNIPVIVLSALGETSTREFAFEMGVRKYLTKPFALTDLVEAIEAQFEVAS
ncbi:MAG: response regulator [Pseudomonadota bacterium]|nr:response regulator [Pseudomonadota bacterium]